MEEQGGSDLRDANSQNTNSTEKTKTSSTALLSLICAIAGPFVFLCAILLEGSKRNGFVWIMLTMLLVLVCFIFSIILGIVGLVRIHKSAVRLKGTGLAITGLVLSTIAIMVTVPIMIVVPRVMQKMEESKNRIAKMQISEIESGLQTYAFDLKHFPPSSQGLDALVHNLENDGSWNGPYLSKELPLDPWRRPYVYRCPGISGEYDIFSSGPDGIEGNNDDVYNREN
jgi:general secretion pathway protein G